MWRYGHVSCLRGSRGASRPFMFTSLPRSLGEGFLDRISGLIAVEAFTFDASRAASIYDVLVTQRCHFWVRLSCALRRLGLLFARGILLRMGLFLSVGFCIITRLWFFLAPLHGGRRSVLVTVSSCTCACLGGVWAIVGEFMSAGLETHPADATDDSCVDFSLVH